MRGLDTGPLYTAHHTNARNDQVSRQKSLEDINEKLDRKKQTEEWLREYSIDKRENNKALYLQNSRGRNKGQQKDSNVISIQVQEEPSKESASF